MFTEQVALELTLLHPPLFQGNAKAAEGTALPQDPQQRSSRSNKESAFLAKP